MILLRHEFRKTRDEASIGYEFGRATWFSYNTRI